MAYKMKGFSGLQNHPVIPPTESESQTSKGTVRKHTRPYKKADGTWVYPGGYSKQKKYKRRRG